MLLYSALPDMRPSAHRWRVSGYGKLFNSVVGRCGSSNACCCAGLQIVKSKVKAEDGRGRFKTTSDKPLRIADREKKPALKT